MPAVNHEERKVGYNYIHCYNTTPSLCPIITQPQIQVMNPRDELAMLALHLGGNQA